MKKIEISKGFPLQKKRNKKLQNTQTDLFFGI